MAPAHPIDTTRLQRYVTSRCVRHAISAAYSTKLNPRNLEVDYYPPYTHSFSDLVDFEFDGALTVRQQYDIWLSKATLDLYKLPRQVFDSLNDANLINELLNSAEEDQGEEAPDSLIPALLNAPHVAGADVAPPPPPEHDPAEEEEGEEDPEPPVPALLDTPRAASADVAPPPPPEHVVQAAEGQDREASTHGRPRRERKAPPSYPDSWMVSKDVKAILNPDKPLTEQEQLQALKNLLKCAIIAEDPSEMQKPDTEDKVFSWDRRMRIKVLHHRFPGIMEIKGCPSRSLRGSKLNARIKNLLAQAGVELYEYVRTCFSRDLCADSAIAISAAGPYWRWIEVKRAEVEAGILDTDELFAKDRAFQMRFAAAPIWVLGSKESDEELNRLWREALIPLIERHATYPSMMVPNPQLEPPVPATVYALTFLWSFEAAAAHSQIPTESEG
ncbi:hypothetical protein C8T65DRAFT_738337 [Cerioporus squamosus]|nr:hypothetical protein C8T65DRAFT_738337 [Cerioporus squamosus]